MKTTLQKALPLVISLGAGLIFSAGLVLSGMTQPAKVIGFLDFTGHWDPTLAFVMAGAVAVSLLAYAVTTRPGRKPWQDKQFHLPQPKKIDRPLLLGAAVFGVGWGLSGYCPGPALASLGTGGWDPVVFAAAMAAGMWVARRFLR